ncbi:hypothetical protein PR048_028475 [Dryococelus australis]|uniref:Uncharacterized protein n=1 Tax=Dryococelus australis TaxID=614101 RepID=A0ABQ9GAM8_9NEOP|nr:hypothetical protein PR048_028475 [Dryococelus australis]
MVQSETTNDTKHQGQETLKISDGQINSNKRNKVSEDGSRSQLPKRRDFLLFCILVNKETLQRLQGMSQCAVFGRDEINSRDMTRSLEPAVCVSASEAVAEPSCFRRAASHKTPAARCHRSTVLSAQPATRYFHCCCHVNNCISKAWKRLVEHQRLRDVTGNISAVPPATETDTSMAEINNVIGYFARLACSPPTKASRVTSPASGNLAGRFRWPAGFLGDLPFPPPLHSGAAPYSLKPSSALKIALLRAAQISSLTHLPPPKQKGKPSELASITSAGFTMTRPSINHPIRGGHYFGRIYNDPSVHQSRNQHPIRVKRGSKSRCGNNVYYRPAGLTVIRVILSTPSSLGRDCGDDGRAAVERRVRPWPGCGELAWRLAAACAMQCSVLSLLPTTRVVPSSTPRKHDDALYCRWARTSTQHKYVGKYCDMLATSLVTPCARERSRHQLTSNDVNNILSLFGVILPQLMLTPGFVPPLSVCPCQLRRTTSCAVAYTRCRCLRVVCNPANLGLFLLVAVLVTERGGRGVNALPFLLPERGGRGVNALPFLLPERGGRGVNALPFLLPERGGRGVNALPFLLPERGGRGVNALPFLLPERGGRGVNALPFLLPERGGRGVNALPFLLPERGGRGVNALPFLLPERGGRGVNALPFLLPERGGRGVNALPFLLPERGGRGVNALPFLLPERGGRGVNALPFLLPERGGRGVNALPFLLPERGGRGVNALPFLLPERGGRGVNALPFLLPERGGRGVNAVSELPNRYWKCENIIEAQRQFRYCATVTCKKDTFTKDGAAGRERQQMKEFATAVLLGSLAVRALWTTQIRRVVCRDWAAKTCNDSSSFTDMYTLTWLYFDISMKVAPMRLCILAPSAVCFVYVKLPLADPHDLAGRKVATLKWKCKLCPTLWQKKKKKKLIFPGLLVRHVYQGNCGAILEWNATAVHRLYSADDCVSQLDGTYFETYDRSWMKHSSGGEYADEEMPSIHPDLQMQRSSIVTRGECFAHSGDAALDVRACVALSVRSLLCHVASGRRPPEELCLLIEDCSASTCTYGGNKKRRTHARRVLRECCSVSAQTCREETGVVRAVAVLWRLRIVVAPCARRQAVCAVAPLSRPPALIDPLPVLDLLCAIVATVAAAFPNHIPTVFGIQFLFLRVSNMLIYEKKTLECFQDVPHMRNIISEHSGSWNRLFQRRHSRSFMGCIVRRVMKVETASLHNVTVVVITTASSRIWEHALVM